MHSKANPPCQSWRAALYSQAVSRGFPRQHKALYCIQPCTWKTLTLFCHKVSMWPWASWELSRSPPASFAKGRYQSLICLPHRVMVGIKLKDAHESVFTSLIWTPAVFICSTFTEYLLLVWYSEEITGLETLHLSSDFNIYWLCSSSGSIFEAFWTEQGVLICNMEIIIPALSEDQMG